MGELFIHGVSLAIIAGALALARRYPRVFGFFAWEAGLRQRPWDSARTWHLRASRYMASLSTLGALLLVLTWLERDVIAHPYLDGVLYFLGPIIIGVGYAYAVLHFALYARARWRDARRPLPPVHRPLL